MPNPFTLTLVTLAGPPIGPFTVRAEGTTRLGRAAECEICLLSDDVSRRHASLLRKRGTWFVTDESSRAGTFLNGVKLPRDTPAPIGSGDLLRVGPWAFRVVEGEARTRAAKTVDDAGVKSQRIDRVGSTDGAGRSDRRLRLLSECIGRLGAAGDEEEAARTVLELAVAGSGYPRAAVLRRLAGPLGTVGVVAEHRANPDDRSPISFSRTLIEQADAGEAVVLSTSSSANVSESLAGAGVHSAMCVPVVVAGSITEYLYMDSRGGESHVRTDASGFCEALATAFGLALANIKRAALERRQRDIQSELDAAREVQQSILPPSQGLIGPARYAMVSRPGSFVVGDLFDAVLLPDGRVVFCLGDVAGHGVGAAMLMASAQSFLNAELLRLAPDEGPASAVTRLNRYLASRPLAGRFLSLWVGVIRPNGDLSYCDAGHGLWLLLQPADDRAHARLEGDLRGIPVGIDPDTVYHDQHYRLETTDQIVVYSDGIVEQRNAAGEPFGRERLLEAVLIGRSAQEDVALVMRELDRFAGVPSLEDDATVAAIEYVRPG
ncbi:MAG: SpoIIE family protein phosphatase [Phycisphaerales bacterium]